MSEPTFVIAGGQRCGTTTLYHALDSHPDVFMARPVRPEPKFFISDESASRGRDWYVKNYFANTGKAIAVGEKSTSYIESPGAAERMAEMFPTLKVVFLLRHPVERAISNYRFTKLNGLEKLPFEEAIAKERFREPQTGATGTSVNPYSYLQRGRYVEYLRPFFDRLGRQSIHVVLTESLWQQPQRAFDRLFAFLDVRSLDCSRVIGERHNEHAADDLKISRTLAEGMRDYFKTANASLSDLLEIDLSHWDAISPEVERLIR